MTEEKNNSKEMVYPQQILTLDDDFALIKAFNEGNESAFRTLVNRHKEKVRNLIYITVGNPSVIDDLAQEVFITVYRKLHLFRFEARFSTWLYRITINKCRDYLRIKKVRSIFSSFTGDEEEVQVTGTTKTDFDINEIVHKNISKLPDKLRIPLILRDIEGMSYQEISETLDTEINTVKTRIFRARENLKKLLSPLEKELL